MTNQGFQIELKCDKRVQTAEGQSEALLLCLKRGPIGTYTPIITLQIQGLKKGSKIISAIRTRPFEFGYVEFWGWSGVGYLPWLVTFRVFPDISVSF